MSVITMTASGLLCYADHVCNYYFKVFVCFRVLPAVLRLKRWFLIKRRRSISTTGVGLRQKKATAANRVRLEAGIHEAIKRMPTNLRCSRIAQDELAKFPVEGEQEMLDQ